MFLKGITEIAYQLCILLMKGCKFSWLPEHELIFNKIKKLWKDELSLIVPDFDAEFVLETDASNVNLWAVHRQEAELIINKPRAFKFN